MKIEKQLSQDPILVQRRERYQNDEEFRNRVKARAAKWYAENKDRQKAYMRRRALDPEQRRHDHAWKIERQYNITIGEWHDMLRAQEGRCAVCGDPMAGALEPQTDHCHETGRVRGLLCLNCNAAEGRLRSDPERARKLFEYMSFHRNISTEMESA